MPRRVGVSIRAVNRAGCRAAPVRRIESAQAPVYRLEKRSGILARVMDNRGPDRTTTEARQATAEGVGRHVLWIGLVLAIVLLVIVYKVFF